MVILMSVLHSSAKRAVHAVFFVIGIIMERHSAISAKIAESIATVIVNVICIAFGVAVIARIIAITVIGMI